MPDLGGSGQRHANIHANVKNLIVLHFIIILLNMSSQSDPAKMLDPVFPEIKPSLDNDLSRFITKVGKSSQ